MKINVETYCVPENKNVDGIKEIEVNSINEYLSKEQQRLRTDECFCKFMIKEVGDMTVLIAQRLKWEEVKQSPELRTIKIRIV